MEKYTCYIESPGGVKIPVYYAESFAEAWDFCNDHHWSWRDENNFVWDLDFVE